MRQRERKRAAAKRRAAMARALMLCAIEQAPNGAVRLQLLGSRRALLVTAGLVDRLAQALSRVPRSL